MVSLLGHDEPVVWATAASNVRPSRPAAPEKLPARRDGLMPLLVGCYVTVHLGRAETAVFADRRGQSCGRWKPAMMFQN